MKEIENGVNELKVDPEKRAELVGQLRYKAEERFAKADERRYRARRVCNKISSYISFIRTTREFYEDERI